MLRADPLAKEEGLDRPVIVAARPGWNPGVVGIVASKLVERYYRPAIVLGIDEEKGIAKGSARSIKVCHLIDDFLALLVQGVDIFGQLFRFCFVFCVQEVNGRVSLFNSADRV